MPKIPAEKVAEWKELVRINELPYGSVSGKGGYIAPGDIWHELEYSPAAVEALPLLLAEREETLALLREVEWGGTGSTDYDEVEPCCPSCGGFKPNPQARQVSPQTGEPFRFGHAPDCRVRVLLYGS
jgi:hypothetical protein